MMIHDITHDDMKNGTGLRTVLWVAGCEHHCPQCQNPITWDPHRGIPFTEWEEAEFWEWLSKPWTEGATFSGGDPLHPENREEIGRLASKIKNKFPEKNIWVYTGYEFVFQEKQPYFKNNKGESFQLSWLSCIDVLVDGRFDCKQREIDIAEKKKVYWRGSSNQKIINIKKTLEKGQVIEYDEY